MSDTDTAAAVVLDTPAQISGWYYLSAVSQLSLEIRSGRNFYNNGKRSVYGALRGRIIPADMLHPAATRANKVLALAMLCYDQPAGPVIDAARALLDEVADTEGLVVTIQ